MGASRVRVLVRAPLPQVWDFVSRPENLHLWGPPTRPVAGFGRPFQVGDRVTFDRRDFLWSHRQALLVEKVVPGRSLQLRDLSAAGMNVTVTLSVEEAEDREATWVEEAIFYSLGNGRALQWLDRRLINPIFNLPVAYKSTKVFRRLESILVKSQADSILAPGPEEHKGA